MSYLAPFSSYRGVFVKFVTFSRVTVFNSLIRGELLNSGLRNLAQKLETSLCRYAESFKRASPVW